MGAIEIDAPEDLVQEFASEKCVGEGGHFFERTGERYQEGDFEVQCERCFIMGWEKPDGPDELEDQEPKIVYPGDTPDDGPRMRMARNRRRQRRDHNHRP